MKGAKIPTDRDNVIVKVGGQEVRLTNLRKPFWPALGITKGGLLQFYLDVAPYLLPHIKDRAMVMRRYPDGADGPSFFMKEAPTPRPPWVRICPIEHGEGKVVNFPLIGDEPSLLWCVNLGCIDLNQWYSRCDDVDRPDYLHFDLDPSEGAGFELVRKAGLIVRDALTTLGMKPYVKTSGSRGLHVYVPIVRGPLQDQVLNFTKVLATELAGRNPKVLTVEYRKSVRPRGRVLVDYRQNAWGQTLASIYSVRPKPKATVSVPLTWDEVEAGADIEDFRVDNVRERLDSGWRSVEADPGREGPHQPRQAVWRPRVRVADFDFELPPAQIAQEPAPRGASRLLVLDRVSGAITHTVFSHLAEFLRPGDLLVVNDTRVFPARLIGRRVPSGGRVECLLMGTGRPVEGEAGAEEWDALVHPGQKLKSGLARGVRGRLPRRSRERSWNGGFTAAAAVRLRAAAGRTVAEAVDALGHVPLPPYIDRADRPEDRDRYQTVYARERGSIAAPTAGLHFSSALLSELAGKGVERTHVTLHVGYGTFKPVRTEIVEEHTVDPEAFEVTRGRRGRHLAARGASGRRVIAVGTTTARVLESLEPSDAGDVAARRRRDERVHLPGPSLPAGGRPDHQLSPAALVAPDAGVGASAGATRCCMRTGEAVARGYRFYSYGDAMLVL